MPIVTFEPMGTKCEAAANETLLDIALTNNIPIQHACGGFCACTTCHVKVLSGKENLGEIEEDEAERMETLDGYSPESRLACQTKVRGDVTVQVVNVEE